MKNLSLLAVLLCLFWSCRKESISGNPDLGLRTTEDSIFFDTVFTNTGSASQVFKIVNDHRQNLEISSIRLKGGNASAFRINADGVPGPLIQNTLIRGGDSIYVFVTVQIDQSSSTTPFLVSDTIDISYNGNRLQLPLGAYARNAHFLKDHHVTGSETWNNDLPYVILGRLTIDSNAKLTISKGCRIFVHADAPIIVNGTMRVEGERYDSTRVIFTGDRLDDPYRDYPASYPGLIFNESSHDNLLHYAIIRNAYQGLVVSGNDGSTKLELNQTIIENAYESGLTAINSSIKATNVLISNCGKNLLLVNGGNYEFVHLTNVAYSNNFVQHKTPVLSIGNSSYNSTGSLVTNPLNAVFTNCILWGEANGFVDNEVTVSKEGTKPFSVQFDHVLWRMKSAPDQSTVISAINQDPEFIQTDNGRRKYDFRLKETSPAVNKGKASAVTVDLDGLPRPSGLPDLGAYEKQ